MAPLALSLACENTPPLLADDNDRTPSRGLGDAPDAAVGDAPDAATRDLPDASSDQK